MTAVPFDFRRPPPGDLERQAGGWLELACRRTAGIWAKTLSYSAELKPGPVEAIIASAGLRTLPDDALGIPLSLPTAADGTIMLALRRPLMLALLAGMLGETPSELPADRDPTVLESSLVGYMVRQLFLDPLELGWPAAEPLQLTAGPPGAPRPTWAGPKTDMVLLATLSVVGPFGEQPVHLMLSRAGQWERLAAPAFERSAQSTDRKQIEELVREMPVDLAVVLGTADLTMSDMSRLKAGDVVVLNQKVYEPLDGLVAGARKFQVWPGAVGTRAAVLIHTLADED